MFAYWGSARVSYGGYNDELSRGAFDTVFKQGEQVLGTVVNDAKLGMISVYGTGDPTSLLELRPQAPDRVRRPYNERLWIVSLQAAGPPPSFAIRRDGQGARFMVVIGFTSAGTRTAVNRQAFDAAYVQRLGHGDAQTENHFYTYFGELILIKARARQLSGALAEDVRQETFLRVLRAVRAPGGLRSAAALGAFVNSVCDNVLRERYRDQKRHRPLADEPAPLADSSAPNAEAQLIGEETTEAVRRTIEGLPLRDRELLRALFMEEREKAEVCRRLGVSRDYLRVLLHRAKNQFRMHYLQLQAAAAPAEVAKADRRTAGPSPR